METKYTPGPWKICPTTGAVVSAEHKWRSDHYKCSIASIYGPDGEAWDAEDEPRANARLIAAAPELLEALTDLQVMARDYLLDPQRTLDRPQFKSAIRDAEAAIAKATS